MAHESTLSEEKVSLSLLLKCILNLHRDYCTTDDSIYRIIVCDSRTSNQWTHWGGGNHVLCWVVYKALYCCV